MTIEIKQIVPHASNDRYGQRVTFLFVCPTQPKSVSDSQKLSGQPVDDLKKAFNDNENYRQFKYHYGPSISLYNDVDLNHRF